MPDLTRPTPLVYPVIHLIPHGVVDVIQVRSVADIAEVVRDRHVDSLTSANGRIDFWFSPSLREPQVLNRRATELLLLATGFTASTVPLLHGQVLLTSHDSSGCLAGLTDDCLDQLHMPDTRGWRDRGVLDRRFRNDARARQRRTTSRAGLRPSS
ncbi:MAG: hypothetical protein QOH91_3061 [Mycobacterium sp.]|nr:hypothetical protein [Mycobacterium sp.]